METPRSSVLYRDTQCSYSYNTRELNSASCPPFLVMLRNILWLPSNINTAISSVGVICRHTSFCKYTAMSKVIKSKVVQHKTCYYEEETDGETHVVKPSLPPFTLKPESLKSNMFVVLITSVYIICILVFF